ncbi:hypothetical protein BDDG_13786, partial [Blastomyces dermatitidis ATCC 18188]
SLYIDRSASADNSELNIKSLIENLKNVIMKELLILYITESSIFFSISSTASFSATLFSVSFSVTLSQSSILVSMSDSPAPAISVLTILTSATSALITVFITSSSHFKKILYRLSELCFSVYTLLLFLLISRIIYYMKT